MCDGVSEGNFPNPEVCQLAAKVLKETGGDAAKACEAVIFRALETDSKDNISCMIVLLGGENRRTATPTRTLTLTLPLPLPPRGGPTRTLTLALPLPLPPRRREQAEGVRVGVGLGLAFTLSLSPNP